jgi:2-polyprenyl-3-methyl-5-hydroxy-6-metoxy-1,4-benzoquinol methylase
MLVKFGNFSKFEYKGIQELSAYRLHSDVMKMLLPFIKPGMKALDFGCGQGAFSQRLADAGLVVDVCDLDTAQLKAQVRNKYQLDLNTAVISKTISEKYDLVVGMEIIEHLQNPWKYISDSISLLNENGIILLSTPNISNFISRLRFFMRGTLLAYEKADLKHGHITPLSFIQLENMFSHFQLEILARGHAGPVPIFHFYGLSRFTLLRNTILPLLYPLLGGPKKGRALVYILKKK